MGYTTPPFLSEHTTLPSYVPSSSEKAENLAALKEEEMLLERYDEEMSRLRELLQTMEEHKLALNKQILQRRSLTSSLRMIPTEILDHIFNFVAESTTHSLVITNSTSPYNLAGRSILWISQVSSRWRNTLLSRPKLWSSIDINAKSITAECRHIIGTYLRNAGSHPLYITIRARYLPISYIGGLALRMIICEIWRCEKLELWTDWGLIDQVTADNHLPPLSFPHLRSFGESRPVSPNETASRTYQWVSQALRNAPNLMRLDTYTFHNPNDFPFEKLTSLRIEDQQCNDVLEMIRNSPNLERFELHNIIPSDSQAPNPVECSSLRKAVIDTGGLWFDEVPELFVSLVMPDLERLELQSDFDGMSDRADLSRLPSSLFTMIAHFSSSLQELVLETGDARWSRTGYTDILRALPNLRCFTARNLIRDKEKFNSECILHLIQRLTIPSTSDLQNVLGSKLRAISLTERQTFMSMDYAVAFLDMLESRARLRHSVGVAQLVSAELRYTMPPIKAQIHSDHISNYVGDPSVLCRIEQLRQNGTLCGVSEYSM
ncbi:hypothetical protein VNI00_003835 [Paramarasmius palmivorus]|uniref:F-box domain-containing protein n=1 Tax=Paramarasmius palmivorus TaxID=297713 RepID=A0AAW0DPX4_9AGAR